jgi:predicted nucleic acid-binding protein
MIILDTNVLSTLIRGVPDRIVVDSLISNRASTAATALEGSTNGDAR